MTQVWMLRTVNGREFKVIVENKNQEKRVDEMIKQSKNNSYEKIISKKVIYNGIHSTKEFESLLNSLV